MRLWLVMSALLTSVAVAAPKPSVVITGPAPVTKWVSKELSKRYTPKVLKTAVSPMPTAKEVRDVTAPSRAVALIICQASGQFVTLQVLNGADGTPLDTVSLKATAKKLPRAMPKPQLAALMFAIGSGKAPGKEAPVAAEPEKTSPEVSKVKDPAEEKKEEPKKELASKRKKEEPRVEPEPAAEVSEEGSTPSTPSAHPALRASVGFGGFNRSFSWAGNPSPSLATASQPFSGDISVDASWYPGAHFTSNFLGNLGVFVTGDFGVGMVSRVQESRFAHSATRIRFGGLVRLPLGDRFALHAHLGYSRHELTTSAVAVNDGSARPNIPNVLFNGFRGGLGFRVRVFSTVELDGLGGFQAVAGKGELGSERFFPAATALAVDVGGGISVGLAEHLRLRAGVEWQRYFVTLNPAETSTFFAQTASDQYITAAASLQWSM
ncbi:MAG: hypothetical protein Q8N23_31630 [Archangium sp.]|nr:hypothetical protein [Archangium sp.]MDP3576223.1 hypothetical protein [Archangium sp.]